MPFLGDHVSRQLSNPGKPVIYLIFTRLSMACSALLMFGRVAFVKNKAIVGLTIVRRKTIVQMHNIVFLL
jgi:hypothetical protein